MGNRVYYDQPRSAAGRDVTPHEGVQSRSMRQG